MKQRFFKLLAIPIVLTMALIAVIPMATAMAAQNASMLVTATGAYMAITITPTSYDFGTVDGGSTSSSTRSAFSVNSTSSITIDILVQAATWTSGGTAWTYGAQAYNTGQILASIDSLSFNVTISTSSTNLTDGLPASGSAGFELRLQAPNDFADSSVNTCNITFTAYRA